MWFGILTLATALIISISAAYYSILGLTAIFAAAFWPIVILGSSLEVGKIVSTLWLHKYWHRAELQYKLYLCSAVAILMLLTSMGVFGFLSKAHSDQSLVSGDVTAQIAIYDEKIKQARDNIAMARSALQQMDAAVDQTMSRSTDERGADKAAQLRRSQANERNRLLREIDTEQKKIQSLNDQRAPIAAEVRKVEAEVGPIKYIAALVYGDNPDANLLERAVRWVIILIVIVFDPLALTLLLAATKTFEWERRNDREHEQDSEVEGFFDRAKNLAKRLDEETYSPPYFFTAKQHDSVDVSEPVETAPVDLPAQSQKRNSVLESLDSMWSGAKQLIKTDPEKPDHAMAEEDTLDKRALRAWKEQNPDGVLKNERHKLRSGKIDVLPWEEPEFVAKVLASEVQGFGNQFPGTAKKGDMFLRVDRLPTILYKFNGTDWIEVDKTLSDNYAYNDAYIDHLIDKIASGEYDPELLSDAERINIEKRLNQNT